ncbi:MAG: PAS domain-containing protein [Aureispira sp.]|nr:PAS domain-containing protein [Aureispira sp.]
MEKISAENNKKNKNLEDSFERVFDLSPDCMLKIRTTDLKFIAVNQQACDLYGYSKNEFYTMSIFDIDLDRKIKEKINLYLDNYRIGEVIDLEVTSKKKNGKNFPVQVRYCKIDDMHALATVRAIVEKKKIENLNAELSVVIDVKKRQNRELKLNKEILKMVARQKPIKDTLNVLAERMEDLLKGLRVCVLLLKEGQLFVKAAPSLPIEFIKEIDGIGVSIDGLPCSVVAATKKQVLIPNLHTNPFYVDCRDLAKQYSITSCWSTPIISSKGAILGTFAFYSTTSRVPTFIEMDLILMATDLAEIAIGQNDYEESLKKINKEYLHQNKELEATKITLEEDKKNLEEGEEQLKEAQRLSKVGSWQYTFDTEELLWSEQQYQTYNLDESIPTTELYAIYLERISERDAYNFRGAIREAIEGDSPNFKYEHKFITTEGVYKYILGIGRVEKDEEGIPLFIKGTEQDVTELKLAQAAAVQNELKFNELISNINEIVFIVELEDKINYDNPITYINGDTIGLFGYTHQELKQDPLLWASRIHLDDFEAVLKRGKKLHETGQPVVREYRFQRKDGAYLWIEDNISVGLGGNNNGSKLYGSARDITKRKKAEEAILEGRERLQLATEAAKLGSYDWQVHENILHWDNRMYELFCLDKEADVLKKNEYIISILHEDDRVRVMNTYLDNLTNKDLFNFKNEYRIFVEGKVKYIESHVIFFRSKKGVVSRVIGTCLDVTERKEAEALLISNEEKDVLLKEIHHRVKNNLQVITSLLSLQSSYLKNEDEKRIFADSQYRINSMAIVHEMLYQSDNLSKLDYRNYLKELSEYLIQSIKGADNNVELILDIPKINLGIDTAIPLGLLINEVLTNSLKYGIKKDDAGIISIAIHKVKTEGCSLLESSFVLEIGDNGAGYSDTINFRNSNSLGLRLINNLTRQLEGVMKKDPSKKGTNYIISFKEV